MKIMRICLLLATTLCLSVSPAFAQDDDEPPKLKVRKFVFEEEDERFLVVLPYAAHAPDESDDSSR